MKLNRTKISKTPLISLDEFKLWARIDHDDEDELLKSLLENAINFFEIKTSRVLQRSKFKLNLQNERVYFDECDEIKICGDVMVKSEFGATLFSGNGSASFTSGYEECPLMIKLWVKNFALNLYENRVNDYKNDAVISFYRIKEF